MHDRQWYRLNEQGMPERVSDDYAYEHKGQCYSSWRSAVVVAREMAAESRARARRALDAAHEQWAKVCNLPEEDPHA